MDTSAFCDHKAASDLGTWSRYIGLFTELYLNRSGASCNFAITIGGVHLLVVAQVYAQNRGFLELVIDSAAEPVPPDWAESKG